MKLTPDQWNAAKTFGLLRSRVHRSGASENFIGACGEIFFNHHLATANALHPVSVAYWYASLKGTADFYLGPRATGIDVKAHDARNGPTYPCFQATPKQLEITGVRAAVWVQLNPKQFGPVDWDVGYSEDIDATILGWSTMAAVQAAPRQPVRGNPVHVIPQHAIQPLAALAAFI